MTSLCFLLFYGHGAAHNNSLRNFMTIISRKDNYMIIALILLLIVALIVFVCINLVPICAVLTGMAMLYLLFFPKKKVLRR